jgi:uncharacterized membrane protein
VRPPAVAVVARRPDVVPSGRRRGLTWGVPATLLALSAIPALAGSARLVELTGGPSVLPARLDPSAVPLGVHIVSVIVYAVLGAFQFSAGLRRHRTRWHRAAGRLLVVDGMVVALSALCLTLLYPRTEGGDLLFLFRLLAGSGMAASIVLGYTAIRRRDIAGHMVWMTRAYALGLGAGTQVFTEGFGQAIFGISDRSTALLQGAGWAINLAVAELVIRRQRARLSANTIVTAR